MDDTLDLSVYLNSEGNAKGFLYDDAGEGYEYQNNEQFLQFEFNAKKQDDAVTVTASIISGNMENKRKFNVILRNQTNESISFVMQS